MKQIITILAMLLAAMTAQAQTREFTESSIPGTYQFTYSETKFTLIINKDKTARIKTSQSDKTIYAYWEWSSEYKAVVLPFVLYRPADVVLFRDIIMTKNWIYFSEYALRAKNPEERVRYTKISSATQEDESDEDDSWECVPLTASDIARASVVQSENGEMSVGSFNIDSDNLSNKGFVRKGNTWSRTTNAGNIKIELTNEEDPDDLMGYGLVVKVTFSNTDDLNNFKKSFQAAGFSKIPAQYGSGYWTGGGDLDISASISHNSVIFQ